MTYSKQGQALTERFESCRLKSYQDVKGVWTIGWGHTRGVYKGMTCTQAQADQWLADDTAASQSNVNRHLTVPVTQAEFDALVDFDFNLGDKNVNTSHLLAYVNAGKLAKAAAEFAKWDHADGKEVAGLLRRRLAEKAEFLGNGQ